MTYELDDTDRVAIRMGANRFEHTARRAFGTDEAYMILFGEVRPRLWYAADRTPELEYVRERSTAIREYFEELIESGEYTRNPHYCSLIPKENYDR